LRDWWTNLAADGPLVFPPHVVVQVKAMACELTARQNVPLSRFSAEELAREAVLRGLVASISDTTVWRWLSIDALKPWQHRSWIFPRDPDFEAKAGPVLDLYQGSWEGKPLRPDEYVISADEKTSIQARIRIHPTQAPAPGSAMRVEHEYERGGSLAYLAAWDVRRAKVFGRCESTTGIEPFGRLVEQVMVQEPYASARRVFWILDNGSSHRGKASVERLQKAWPTLKVVHLPVHASWLNQIEIYFSIVQRKVVTPNDFTSLAAVEERLIAFQERFEQTARPFEWKFNRADLTRLMARLSNPTSEPLALCA
jgi:transposase